MAKQDSKVPTSRVKDPFPKRGRTRNINELIGDDEPSSSKVGDLGQAFRDALVVEPAPDSVSAPAVEKPTESEKPQTATGRVRSGSAATVPVEMPSHGDDGVMIALDQIIENPKLQPRLRINEDHVISLSDKFRRSGQLNAILVRPVDGKKNLYEIIGGNHRYRAAQRLAWTHIRSNIKRVSFNEARIMSVDDNDSLLPRTDYEKALSYQGLLDDNIASSYREVAEELGISKGRVTQCMSFLALPAPVLRILDDRPDLFSYRTALDLKKVMAKNSDSEGIVNERAVQAMVDGIMRLIDKDAPLSSLIHWIDQNLSGKAPFTSSVEAKVVVDNDGRPTFKTRARENSVVIEWDKKVTFTADQIQDALLNVLKDLAQEAER